MRKQGEGEGGRGGYRFGGAKMGRSRDRPMEARNAAMSVLSASAMTSGRNNTLQKKNPP